MARNYQVKSRYHIDDHFLYMEMLNLMKGYNEMRARRTKILYGSPAPPDGMPRGGNVGFPTEDKAVTLAAIDSRIEAIQEVLAEMQCKYGDTFTGEPFEPYEAFMDYGIFCYYRSRKDRDTAPTQKTWSRYRSEVLYKLAKKLKLF